jgi:3-hydroxymyristoyl/3-hydroxydecanoyl-(acyl carrier protein) dehydratase
MTCLSIDDIADRLPHRHENLLLDSCTILNENEAQFELTLQPNDALARDIFIIDYNGTPCIPSPLLTEISALACISSANQQFNDSVVAYFAAISQFSSPRGPFPVGQQLIGHTQKLSGKNNFHKYGFKLSSQGYHANGQLMAYYDHVTNVTAESPPPSQLPDHIIDCLSKPLWQVSEFKQKKPSMTFVSASHGLWPTEALYAYSYPSTHPFIKGHFPKNPVMMGVCQWQMLEDALTDALTQKMNPTPHEDTISCNAIIFKSDLTPACDIKGAKLMAHSYMNQWQVSTVSVKKIMFKQRVSPNDQLFIYISEITPQFND